MTEGPKRVVRLRRRVLRRTRRSLKHAGKVIIREIHDMKAERTQIDRERSCRIEHVSEITSGRDIPRERLVEAFRVTKAKLKVLDLAYIEMSERLIETPCVSESIGEGLGATSVPRVERLVERVSIVQHGAKVFDLSTVDVR